MDDPTDKPLHSRPLKRTKNYSFYRLFVYPEPNQRVGPTHDEAPTWLYEFLDKFGLSNHFDPELRVRYNDFTAAALAHVSSLIADLPHEALPYAIEVTSPLGDLILRRSRNPHLDFPQPPSDEARQQRSVLKNHQDTLRRERAQAHAQRVRQGRQAPSLLQQVLAQKAQRDKP